MSSHVSSFDVSITYSCDSICGVAPGDEDPLCEALRTNGVAPMLSYSANMRVLMDSWNYLNLLPPRTGAVWDQVDNDTNNPVQITTNVSVKACYSCMS